MGIDFFAGTASRDLATEKTPAGSATMAKSACAAKTFLNDTCAEPPPLMATGPCGLGGSAMPRSATTYSPPSALDAVSVEVTSPSLLGSNVTSTATSAPCEPSAAGATTLASTSNSAAPSARLSLYVSCRRR